MSDISGLLFFEMDIYHLIENALCSLKADLQGNFRKLRDNFQQISGNSALLVVTRENIIKFKNIDFMGFYVFEIDNF